MSNSIFGEPNVVMEGSLKNPHQFRDAVLFEHLSALPNEKIKEFVSSKEAKFMLSEGHMSPDVIDRLNEAMANDTRMLKLTVCHMAKENNDPLWEALVKCRLEERSIMNAIVERYADEGSAIAESAKQTFVESCVPEYFR